MPVILGWLISLVTFPGIILHEVAHWLCCNLAGVPIFKVRFFRLGTPAGYVVHGLPDNFGAMFLVTVAPFFVNTVAAITVYLAALNVTNSVTIGILFWLGISIGMHSLPSRGDADNLWNYSKQSLKRSIWAVFGLPFTLFIRLAALLNTVWFNLLYSIALLVLCYLLWTLVSEGTIGLRALTK
jgi:hypothetical protein